MRNSFLIISLLLAALVAAAQQPPSTGPSQPADLASAGEAVPEIRTLHVVETMSAGEPIGPMTMFPIFCDQDGNVFLRKHNDENPFVSPIVKLDPKAKLVQTFSIASVAPGMNGGDYAVNNGRVYQVASELAAVENFVLVYDRDGSLKSKIKLDTQFDANGQIVVFDNGNMLLTGLVSELEKGKSTKPFTALFDSSGKMLKKIGFTDDDGLHDKVKALSPNARFNFAVNAGRALVASDGNAYVLRQVTPALVYVVSPAGEVVRSFSIDPGKTGLVPVNTQVSEGRLAVFFKSLGPPPVTAMVVTDLEGNVLENYDVGDELGLSYACYSPPSFTWGSGRGGKISLMRAEPR